MADDTVTLVLARSWLTQWGVRGLNASFPSGGAGLRLRAYTNDVTPTETSALGDFVPVPAGEGGYAEKALPGPWAATLVGSEGRFAHADVAFDWTGGLLAGKQVRGLYVVDAAGNYVAAGRLTNAYTPAAYRRLTASVLLQAASGPVAPPSGNVAPTAPALTLVGVASGQATVALAAASTDSDGTVAGYQLYVNGVAWGALQTGWSQGTNRTVTGLLNGVAVSLTAKAQDDDGALSVDSNAVAATPANQAPTAPVISVPATGDGTVTVRLGTASTDTEDGTLATYEVYANGVKNGADRTGWAAGANVTLTGLTNGVSYTITARGKDSAGLLSAASNGVAATPSGVADTTPNQFTFADVTGVALSTPQTSDPVTLSGITAATTITVSGGQYSVNGGTPTASAGTVVNGDQVRAHHTSSASFSTAVSTTVTIGGVADTFTSTTLAQDTTPAAFDFPNQTGVALNTAVVSDAVTLSGINSPATVSALTGGLSYRVNGGGWIATTGGTVANGQQVEVRLTSSASFGTQVSGSITIGGVSDTFAVTTVAQDTTPDAFTFTDVSNANLATLYTSNTITVAGINSPAAISIDGGEYQVNGGAWTSGSGTVANGATVAVRGTSAGSAGTSLDVVLTIGGVSDTYTITTGNAPAAPTITSVTPGDGQNVVDLGTVAGATSYNLYVVNANSFPAWDTTAEIVANGTTFTGVSDPYTHGPGLTNGHAYRYVQTAVNAFGESAGSAVVSGTPVAVPASPTGVSATAGDAQVVLAWTKPAGATNFDVKWGTSAGSHPNTIADVGDVATYTHTGRANGTAYYYVVVAKNASGSSADSSEVNATPAAAGGPSSVTDDFTGTSTNWTQMTGRTAMTRGGGVLVGDADSDGLYWSANTFQDNQYSGGTITPTADAGFSGGFAVRAATDANTFYSAEIVTTDGGKGGAIFTLRLYKTVAGVKTELGNGWATNGSPQYIQVKAVGTTISALHGATTRISVTDSAIASGRLAIVGRGTFDNWGGGNAAS